MNNIKGFGNNNAKNHLDGCNCVQPINGVWDDLKAGLTTPFFDEIFPKDSSGKRALVTRIEIDTPSLIKIGAIMLGAIIVMKKLK